MTYIGRVQGIKGYHFMTFDNQIFMCAMATFDETVFPHRKENTVPETTRFGDEPGDES